MTFIEAVRGTLRGYEMNRAAWKAKRKITLGYGGALMWSEPGILSTYVPTTEDILEDDWCIYEEE